MPHVYFLKRPANLLPKPGSLLFVVTRDSRATARSDGASDAYADQRPRSAARGAGPETPRACKNPGQEPWAVGCGHVDGRLERGRKRKRTGVGAGGFKKGGGGVVLRGFGQPTQHQHHQKKKPRRGGRGETTNQRRRREGERAK
jgi:hypothetical protein